MHKHNFGQTLKLQSAVATIDIRSRSSIHSFLTPSMFLCKFGGENPTGSEARAQKRLILLGGGGGGLRMITLKTRSVSLKSCQLFILRQ